MRRLLTALVLAAAALGVLPSAAGAARIYTVSQSDLAWFDSASPQVELGSAPLSGIGPGEVVKGLDSRPGTSPFLLFTTAGAVGALYDLDPATGVASERRTLDAPLTGTEFGFDVSPVSGEVRIVSNDDENVRVDPANGEVASDTDITPASNGIAAVAYTNVDTDVATGTSLFDYGYDTDVVYEQSPEDDGSLTTVGSSGTSAQSSAGFLHMDIAADGRAFATLQNGGWTYLYAINLGTGHATELGSTAMQQVLGMTAVNNVVSLTATELHVSESGGNVSVRFGRAAPFDSSSVFTAIGVSTANGTAGADDFTPSALSGFFTPGLATVSAIVPITDDELDEPDETFTVSAEPFGSTLMSGPGTATVTIHDDDPTRVTETRTETVVQTETETRTVFVDPPPIVLLPGRCANARTGTAADDALQGTSAGDRITGLGGADGLAGLAGDDCLDGGAGGDLLSGGEGADELKAGSGENVVYGGGGADAISVRNRRRDVVDCGAGRDRVTADPRDRLRRCERVTRRRR